MKNTKRHARENPSAAGAYTDAASSARIEALKELTRALLREVEWLNGSRPVDEVGERLSVDFNEEVRRFDAELIR